jgi:linoleate 9S-lipoxygenase
VRHIIWTASALHAAVDFEQHPCARTGRWWAGAGHGGVREELQRDPEKVSVRTITSQVQAIVGISLLEILSSHSSNEVYLGQRDTPEWTRTPRRRRRSGGSGSGWRRSRLKNRVGPAKFLYTLLYPNTDRKGDAPTPQASLPKGSQQHLHLINPWSPVNRAAR